MAINGSLDEASLADVLQLLSLGQKTGRLSVSDQSNLGHIYVDDGKITHAFLVNRHHRLGDILFKSGLITQGQLNEAMQLQAENPEKKVGEFLVETGATTDSELSHYMKMQIEEAVYFLLTWRRGDFAFERDVKPDPEDFLVSINPESLLLEGARRVDEWSVIEKKIPSFNMVFRVDEKRIESSEATLSEEQKRIASMLDGKHDVATIVAESRMIEFEVGQALYGLITIGFAEAVGPGEVAEPDNNNGEAGTDHLDHEALLAFIAHQGEFANEEVYESSELHIADCPTCSKRLHEMHVRRSQGLSPIPERRSESDRRQTDGESLSTSARDRRVHGAGDRRSSTRTAAVTDKTHTRRERRSVVRRKRERRRGTPVDRSDKMAVERRRGMERRLRERRVEESRTEAGVRAVAGRRKTVSMRKAKDTDASSLDHAPNQTSQPEKKPEQWPRKEDTAQGEKGAT